MFGFGKKNKNTEERKAIEFDIVTMESALQETPKNMVASAMEDRSGKETEKQQEKLNRQQERIERENEKHRRKEEEKAATERLKIERENEEARMKELRLLKEEREEQLAQARKRQEEEQESERRQQNKLREEHEADLELQRKKIAEQKSQQEAQQKEQEMIAEQKRLEEKRRMLEQERIKRQEELERLEQLERQKAALQQKQLEQEMTVANDEEAPEPDTQANEPNNATNADSSTSPFLTEEDETATEVPPDATAQNEVESSSSEQVYAQALSAQRNEEVRQRAMEELARHKSILRSPLRHQMPSRESFEQTDNSMSNDLETRDMSDEELQQPKIYRPKKDHNHSQGITFDSSEIKPPKSSVNKPLMVLAVALFLITAAAGAYYYFFVINAPKEEWTPINIPLPLKEDTSMLDPIMPSPTTTKTNVLKNASLRSLNEKDIAGDLKKLASALKSDSSKSAMLEQGIFIKPVKTDGQQIKAADFLSSLGINNEQINSSISDDIWLFFVKEEQNTLTDQLSVVKVNLVMAINQAIETDQAIEKITSTEQQLPSQLVVLFVDENKPSIPQTVQFQQSTTSSQIFSKTRFFNYSQGSSRHSIDWGIANYLEKDYLVISTSKNSTDKFIATMK